MQFSVILNGVRGVKNLIPPVFAFHTNRRYATNASAMRFFAFSSE